MENDNYRVPDRKYRYLKQNIKVTKRHYFAVFLGKVSTVEKAHYSLEGFVLSSKYLFIFFEIARVSTQTKVET